MLKIHFSYETKTISNNKNITNIFSNSLKFHMKICSGGNLVIINKFYFRLLLAFIFFLNLLKCSGPTILKVLHL